MTNGPAANGSNGSGNGNDNGHAASAAFLSGEVGASTLVLRDANVATNTTPGRPSLAAIRALIGRIRSEAFSIRFFRPHQEEAILRIIEGHSVLFALPGAAGKSLCYQLPLVASREIDRIRGCSASEHPGLTLVTSPFPVLSNVGTHSGNVLLCVGLPGCHLASGMTSDPRNWARLYHPLRDGCIRILFCSAEMLKSTGFLDALAAVPGGIRRVVAEEAHQLSEENVCFRPEYFRALCVLSRRLKPQQFVLLTATAPLSTTTDLRKRFCINDDGCHFTQSSYRSNVDIRVMTANPSHTRRASDLDVYVWKRPLKLDSDWAKYRANATLRFLREHKGPAIIYCTNPSQAEAIVKRLMPDDPQDGTLTVPFHEELPVAERQWLLHRFERGLVQNIVVTFGSGFTTRRIDVAKIVHWDLPLTIEDYIFQINRGGRNGKQVLSLVWLSPVASYFSKYRYWEGLPSRGAVEKLVSQIIVRGTEQARKQERLVGNDVRSLHYNMSELGRHFNIHPEALNMIVYLLEHRHAVVKSLSSFRAKVIFSTITPSLIHKDEAILDPSTYKMQSPAAQAVWRCAKSLSCNELNPLDDEISEDDDDEVNAKSKTKDQPKKKGKGAKGGKGVKGGKEAKESENKNKAYKRTGDDDDREPSQTEPGREAEDNKTMEYTWELDMPKAILHARRAYRTMLTSGTATWPEDKDDNPWAWGRVDDWGPEILRYIHQLCAEQGGSCTDFALLENLWMVRSDSDPQSGDSASSKPEEEEEEIRTFKLRKLPLNDDEQPADFAHKIADAVHKELLERRRKAADAEKSVHDLFFEGGRKRTCYNALLEQYALSKPPGEQGLRVPLGGCGHCDPCRGQYEFKGMRFVHGSEDEMPDDEVVMAFMRRVPDKFKNDPFTLAKIAYGIHEPQWGYVPASLRLMLMNFEFETLQRTFERICAVHSQ